MENIIYDQIQNQKSQLKTASTLLDVFSESKKLITRSKSFIDQEQFTYLAFNTAVLKELTPFIRFKVPLKNSEILLELLEADSSFQAYSVITSDGNSYSSNPNIKHYRGIIENDKQSIVAVTFLEDQVMGLISTTEGNLNLAFDLESNSHLLYNDRDALEKPELICRTDENLGPSYDKELLGEESKLAFDQGSKCVKFYLETEFDIYQTKGSVAAVEGYVSGLMNQVGLLYLNENILTGISQIYIWNTPDPYTATSTDALLQEFQAYTNSINGDLGHLLTFRSIGGGKAAGFDGLCNNNVDNKLAVSMIFDYYSGVPNYSWSVQVVTHEFGHLLGSRHTHACVWNGNNTAIDGCAGSTEGGCPLPPIPQGGGTIMSYCHQTVVGINFNLGFGPQPGNVIRSRVNSAPCLTPCLTISGPNTVCNSGVYSINNLPSGATVTWTATPANLVSLITSGNTVTVNKISDGNVVLDASINIGGSVFTATSKSIIVGIVPTIPYFVSSGYFNNLGDPYNLTAVACARPGNRTIILNFSGVQNLVAYVIYGGNYPQVVNTTVYWVYPESGSGFVLLFQYDGPCGRVSQRITFQNSCPYRFAVDQSKEIGAITISYPEIDSFYKELKIQQAHLSISLNEKTEVYSPTKILFRLLNEKGVILIEKESTIYELQTSLSISNYPAGKYYLHIISNNELVTEEIIIS